MMGEGETNWQSCEGVTDRVDEQRPWGDATEMKHALNKMRLKPGSPPALAFRQGIAYKAALRRNPPTPF